MGHELIIEGKLTARCSCGQWQYVGVLAEAKKAIKELYEYHSKFDCQIKSKRTPLEKKVDAEIRKKGLAARKDFDHTKTVIVYPKRKKKK